MMCSVITRYHPMVGCDFHTADPPFPIPLPIPGSPHLVFAMARVGPWWMATPKESTLVDTAAGAPLAKIFDIGMLIPHIGVNHIIPMFFLTLFSASQGHFGVQSVQIQTNEGSGPVAVALALYVNPQLDCNDFLPWPKMVPFALPLPLPTGLLFAPNTVVAGLTLGDLLAGIVSMVMTSVATLVIGGIASGLAWGAGELLKRGVFSFIGLFNNRMPTWLFSALLKMKYSSGIPVLGHPLKDGTAGLMSILFGWSIGSPMGYSSTTTEGAALRGPFDAPAGSLTGWPIQPFSDAAGAWFDRNVGDPLGLNDYFNNVALAPTFPIAPYMPPLMPVSAETAGGIVQNQAGDADDVRQIGEIIDGIFRKP